jgi:hypothetical protein
MTQLVCTHPACMHCPKLYSLSPVYDTTRTRCDACHVAHGELHLCCKSPTNTAHPHVGVCITSPLTCMLNLS